MKAAISPGVTKNYLYFTVFCAGMTSLTIVLALPPSEILERDLVWAYYRTDLIYLTGMLHREYGRINHQNFDHVPHLLGRLHSGPGAIHCRQCQIVDAFDQLWSASVQLFTAVIILLVIPLPWG
jgi:hypothetical protein